LFGLTGERCNCDTNVVLDLPNYSDYGGS